MGAFPKKEKRGDKRNGSVMVSGVVEGFIGTYCNMLTCVSSGKTQVGRKKE